MNHIPTFANLVLLLLWFGKAVLGDDQSLSVGSAVISAKKGTHPVEEVPGEVSINRDKKLNLLDGDTVCFVSFLTVRYGLLDLYLPMPKRECTRIRDSPQRFFEAIHEFHKEKRKFPDARMRCHFCNEESVTKAKDVARMANLFSNVGWLREGPEKLDEVGGQGIVLRYAPVNFKRLMADLDEGMIQSLLPKPLVEQTIEDFEDKSRYVLTIFGIYGQLTAVFGNEQMTTRDFFTSIFGGDTNPVKLTYFFKDMLYNLDPKAWETIAAEVKDRSGVRQINHSRRFHMYLNRSLKHAKTVIKLLVDADLMLPHHNRPLRVQSARRPLSVRSNPPIRRRALSLSSHASMSGSDSSMSSSDAFMSSSDSSSDSPMSSSDAFMSSSGVSRGP